MNHEDLTHQAIETLLAAIESRDLRKVERALHPDIVWQNVPHPPSVGRDAVIPLLASIICLSDKVQWDILSSSVSGDTGWYERLDHFWIAHELRQQVLHAERGEVGDRRAAKVPHRSALEEVAVRLLL